MSQICGMLKTPGKEVEVECGSRVFQAKIFGHFSPISVPRYRRALISLELGRLWCWRAELKAVHKGPVSLRPRCDGVIAP
jgi:hypothetical protein